MWQSFLSFAETYAPWESPVLACFGMLLFTLALHLVYKHFFLKEKRLILYVIVRAAHAPLLALVWVVFLKFYYDLKKHLFILIHYALPEASQVLVIYKLIVLLIFIWFFVRLLSITKQKLLSNYLTEDLDGQIVGFVFGALYSMLCLLFIVGVLYCIKADISPTFTAIIQCIIIWGFTIVLLYIIHTVLTEYVKILLLKGYFWRYIFAEASRAPMMLSLVGVVLIFSLQTLGIKEAILSGINYWEPIFLPLFWFIYKGSMILEEQLLLGRLTKKYPDRVKIQAISKLSRIALAIVILFFLTARGGSTGIVASLLTGASVALGFAARGIISNYLSGLILHFEGKFKVGDWIYFINQKEEGTIEYMGLHAVEIRTLDKRLLTVPNDLFSSKSVVNASKMTNRRIQQTILMNRASYPTLVVIIQQLRVMLQDHPGIDPSQRLMVHFINLGPYSFDLALDAFTKTKDLKTYRNIIQDILLKAIQIIEENGGSLALPTHRLYPPALANQSDLGVKRKSS